MKKIIFVLMTLLVTSPVFAAGVAITLTERLPDANLTDPCKVVVVSYTNTDGQHVRAFGLNVNIKAAMDANITAVKCGNTQYTIYPGTITINADGTISPGNWGTCLCNRLHAGTPPSKAVTIEMGSLGIVPADSGVLAEITIQGHGIVDVNTTLNAIRGGIVMENAAAPTGSTMGSVQLSLPVNECVNSNAPFYAAWLAANKPDCWCYSKNCKGDADGKQQYGMFWVYTNDLTVLKNAFAQGTLPAGGICADFARDIQYGMFRVYTNDLAILKASFAQTVTDCTMAPNYNFWKTAP